MPNIALDAIFDSPGRTISTIRGVGNREHANALAVFVWQHATNPQVKDAARRFHYLPYADGKGKRRERGSRV